MTERLLDLSGKVALVLGAVGNLGTSITQSLMDHGASVAINYYKGEQEKADRLLERLDPGKSRMLSLFCDVNEEESVRDFMQAVKDRFGRVDILVNLVHNPEFVPKKVTDMDWADWRNHLIAQKGHFLLCKYAVPIMREHLYGRIIYISGGLAVRHMGGSAAFAAVKSGLTAFSKTLAIEEGPNNITVNIVAPGKITSLETDGEFSWNDKEQELLERTPLRRFATQEDVADAVLYFASPLADAMTGQTLYVACGEIML